MKRLLTSALIISQSLLIAQNLFPHLEPVFIDKTVPRIDIILPQDSLARILAPGNQQSDYHWHATFIFDNGEIKDTVKDVGFRLRGNTSRNSKKKSFKVSFNTYAQGRKWQGLEKLNLNGEHNDPTVARSKICWDMLRWMKIPAPRSNHVALYINGNLFGLYINVEHIDEVFVKSRFGNNGGNLYKCLWPADLTYKGSNPDLYKLSSGGRRAYELITNTDKDDYKDLANFIAVLNNTPASQLPCELEKVFNVDVFLKAAAFDVLTANWDGPIYNKNNFYLYKNEATGKFEYIPYDLDNTFGIDWFKVNWATRNIYAWQHPTEPRPIFTKLMLVDEYRNRYSYFLDKYIKQFYNLDSLTLYLNQMRNLIAPIALIDPYRPLDYGFSYEQFLKAFDESLSFNHTPWGIKPFINARKVNALQQLFLSNINPIIRNVTYNQPTNLQNLFVQTEVEDDGKVTEVKLCYSLSGQNQICRIMLDDGKNGDARAGDGWYASIVPTTGITGQYEFHIEVTDNSFRQSRYPVCGSLNVNVTKQNIPLVINEFLASNGKTIKDEAGQYDDWVEILNLGTTPINLGNLYLSDSETNRLKWKFPDYTLQPMQYLLVWTDDDVHQGPMHTSFKLDASGEYIGIFDSAGVLIDGVKFGFQQTDISWGRLPNGTGPFQAMKPTPGSSNAPLTNTEDPFTKTDWKVYPNPFVKSFTLSFDKQLEQPIILTMVDLAGRIIHEETLKQGTSTLSLNLDNPPGLYFLRLTHGHGKYEVFKLVKLN